MISDLIAPALAALDDTYPEIGDFVAQKDSAALWSGDLS